MWGVYNNTQVVTTAGAGTVVHVTDDAELTIMRGALFDLSSGGDFVVENGSELIGGSGSIVLGDGGTLIASEDSYARLWRGSIDAASLSHANSTVIMNGTLILGRDWQADLIDGVTQISNFGGANLVIGENATITATDEFAKLAYAGSDYDNTLALYGTTSLTYNPVLTWLSGDRALIKSIWADFVFTRAGNEIYFKGVDKVDMSTVEAAHSSAVNHVAGLYAEAGVDSRMTLNGLPVLVLRSAFSNNNTLFDVANPGFEDITGDGSDAGNLHMAILTAMTESYGTIFNASGVSGILDNAFLTNYANISTNNRGANINTVAMGTATRMQNSVGDRVIANNAALARVRDDIGSDAALASAILNSDYMNRIWIGGLGMWEDADNRKGKYGYKYDSYGFITGYDRLFGPMTVGAAFGYSYNFNNDGMNSSIIFNGLGTGAFHAKGRELGRHTFNTGAGVKFSKDRYDFGVRYDYYGKADYDAHRVAATFGISF